MDTLVIKIKYFYIIQLFIVFFVSQAAFAGKTCSYKNLIIPEPSFGGCPEEGRYLKTWEGLISSGTLVVPWNRYGDYLQVLERQYQERFSLHFNERKAPEIKVTGRCFYEQPWEVDGGRILFERLMNGDQVVSNFLHMGWNISLGQDGLHRVIPPKTFKSFLEGFYSGYEVYRAAGGDAVYPGIAFFNEKTKAVVFVRPGIDVSPPSTEWRLAYLHPTDPVDTPFDDFAKTVAESIFPLNAFMFDHDISHVAEYLQDNEILRCSVGIFRQYLGKKEPKINLAPPFTSNHNPYALGVRIGLCHEEMAVPNLDKKDQIRALIPHLFEDPRYQTVSGHKELSSHENLPDLIGRASRIASQMDRIVIRHGGGMLDSYNLYLELNVRSQAEKRVLLALNSGGYFTPFFGRSGREAFSQKAIESLYGIADDLQFLADLLRRDSRSFEDWIIQNWGTHDMTEKKQAIKQLFFDRLARLEIALWAGVEYQITPAQFVKDASHQFIQSNSALLRYVSSYAIPGSLTYDVIVHPLCRVHCSEF